MTKYFRWELNYPADDFLRGYWPKMRGGDNLESVYWLYNRAGEAWLLELAKKIHDHTADWTTNLGLVSTTAVWLVQVCALVVGHVSGLAAAHDRALVMYDGKAAAQSQYWMLAVMVGFTCLGLWLLSA